MAGKQETHKKSFEVIREGVARARFGGAFGSEPVKFADGFVAGVTGPVTFAPVEDNAGFPPEEYYACNARMLTKAVTPYRKFDFTQGNVLKDAVSIFEGLTLYANHWVNVENWKGKTQNAVWDEKNTPNGINCLVLADRIVDPKLARGLETKALRSFSVTIWFEYTKSHPDLANFYDRLGEEIDGEMVRLIVTRITNAGELSVVWEGEDPYAKSFAGGDPPAKPSNKEEGDMKLTAATLAVLGIAAGTEVTAEMLETKINETVTGLTDKAAGLETKVAELQPDAALGKQLLKETRERAAALYKAAKGEKVIETFITGVIEKADLTVARGLCQEYESELDKTVPLTCPKCGEKLSRRSSMGSEDNPAGVGKRADDYKV